MPCAYTVRSRLGLLTTLFAASLAPAGHAADSDGSYEPPKTGTRSDFPSRRLPPPVSAPATTSQAEHSGYSGTLTPVEPTSQWYGDEILYTDGAILLLTVPTIGVALLAYPLGGPIVHAIHGNWGRAAGSLALRIGLPILGGGIANGIMCESRNSSRSSRTDDYYYDDSSSYCALGAALVGGSLGILAAMAVDSAAIAWEVPGSDTEVAALRLTPTFAPLEGGVSAGVVGTF
jgi:hypothetical protein